MQNVNISIFNTSKHLGTPCSVQRCAVRPEKTENYVLIGLLVTFRALVSSRRECFSVHDFWKPIRFERVIERSVRDEKEENSGCLQLFRCPRSFGRTFESACNVLLHLPSLPRDFSQGLGPRKNQKSLWDPIHTCESVAWQAVGPVHHLPSTSGFVTTAEHRFRSALFRKVPTLAQNTLKQVKAWFDTLKNLGSPDRARWSSSAKPEGESIPWQDPCVFTRFCDCYLVVVVYCDTGDRFLVLCCCYEKLKFYILHISYIVIMIFVFFMSLVHI